MEKKRKRDVSSGIHKTKRFNDNFENLMGGKRFKRNWNVSQKSGPRQSKTNRLITKLTGRKRKRQEERKLKKARKLAFSQKKPVILT